MSNVQRKVMEFVVYWVREHKTPVPRQEIFEELLKVGIKDYTAANAIESLLRKRYIRKAYLTTRKTCYVQIKTL